MKTGAIKITTVLQSNFRIDPSLHLSEGVKCRNILKKSPYGLKTVGECSSRIFLGNIFSRCFVKSKDFGVTYLSASDTVLADIETGRYISRKQAEQLSYLMLEKDWILATCSGTLGNITYTNKHFCDKIATHDLIRIIPADSKMKKGCLYAFLSSKYGYYQITQSQFGGVVKHINDKQLGNVLIPNFPYEFQKEVDYLVQKSAHNRELAADDLQVARELFESEIGGSFVNFGYNSKIISSKYIAGKFRRFDSQYQIGKIELTKYERTIKIEEVKSEIFTGNRGKRMYVTNGVPFLSSSDMILANPLRFCKYISKATPALSDMKVNYKDILISRSGTVGNTIIVGKCLSGIAVSEHAMRLVIDPDKIAPEYVFAYLMTQHGQDALHTLPYGSVIVTLGEEVLGDIDLPIIERSKMESIVNRISSYMYHLGDDIVNENKDIHMCVEETEK